MKILVSAYACEPNRGSEPGVGWNWALAYRAVGDVWVVTRANNRPVIEAWEHTNGKTGIHWIWVDAAAPILRLKRLIGIRPYVWYWQRLAGHTIRSLEVEHGPFAWVHHLTMNGFREPGRLDSIQAPIVWGPIGGVQNADFRLSRLRGSWPAVVESVRSLTNRMTQHYSQRALAAARNRTLVLGANIDAMRWLQRFRKHQPTVHLLEAGMPTVNAVAAVHRDPDSILWVGNDGSHKNPEFAVLAWSILRRINPRYRLTLIGLSPGRCQELRRWSEFHGIDPTGIELMPPVPQAALAEHYRTCQLFWFTSYRDTSGNVLLEALAFGATCMAFNHQGAATILANGRGHLIEGRFIRDRLRRWCRTSLELMRRVSGAAAAAPLTIADPNLVWSLKPLVVAHAMSTHGVR